MSNNYVTKIIGNSYHRTFMDIFVDVSEYVASKDKLHDKDFPKSIWVVTKTTATQEVVNFDFNNPEDMFKLEVHGFELTHEELEKFSVDSWMDIVFRKNSVRLHDVVMMDTDIETGVGCPNFETAWIGDDDDNKPVYLLQYGSYKYLSQGYDNALFSMSPEGCLNVEMR
jgi:hypothetical protein